MVRVVAAWVVVSLAVFALQEVPRGHGAWTLAGAAVVAGSLPLLLAFAERTRAPPSPATRTGLIWTCRVFALAQLGFAIDAHGQAQDHRHRRDHGRRDRGAGAAAAIPTRCRSIRWPAASAAGGAAFHGYKYLPVMMAVYAPLCLALGMRGIVVTNIVLQGATAASLRALAGRGGGAVAGLCRGGDLSQPAVPRLPALHARRQRSCRFAAAAFGAAAARAASVLGGGADRSVARGRSSCRRSRCCRAWCRRPVRGGDILPGVAVGLLPVVPFVLAAPGAFADNILLFNALRPVDDTSWLYGMPGARRDRRARRGAGGLAVALCAGLAPFASPRGARGGLRGGDPDGLCRRARHASQLLSVVHPVPGAARGTGGHRREPGGTVGSA